MLKSKIDCSKNCTSGILNSACTLCECAETVNGRVRADLVGVAGVEIRAVNQEWEAVAITDSLG